MDPEIGHGRLQHAHNEIKHESAHVRSPPEGRKKALACEHHPDAGLIKSRKPARGTRRAFPGIEVVRTNLILIRNAAPLLRPLVFIPALFLSLTVTRILFAFPVLRLPFLRAGPFSRVLRLLRIGMIRAGNDGPGRRGNITVPALNRTGAFGYHAEDTVFSGKTKTASTLGADGHNYPLRQAVFRSLTGVTAFRTANFHLWFLATPFRNPEKQHRLMFEKYTVDTGQAVFRGPVL